MLKSSTKKQATRTSRAAQRRQIILDCALAQVSRAGFRAVSVESIAAATGVAKTTLYRCWPNKAAIVMDAFMARVHYGTVFEPNSSVLKSVQKQMRAMAKAFRGRDGTMIRSLLAEAQFDTDLATAFRERWTQPRRSMALATFREAIRQGELREDIDVEATIDLLYAPMYYRLQMGISPLTEAYIDTIFQHAMKGLATGSNTG